MDLENRKVDVQEAKVVADAEVATDKNRISAVQAARQNSESKDDKKK
jgi:hypothetical protein